VEEKGSGARSATWRNFWTSIGDDLSEEDRQCIMEDWTEYGRFVVINEDGTPYVGDP
jgi:hypothetical protein